MCLDTRACEEPTSAGVWWRDDSEWKMYDAPQAGAIQSGIANGAKRVDLGNVVSVEYAGGAQYVVDLCTMKQINLQSGYTRDVKVVKVPANTATAPVTTTDENTSIKEELRACQKSIRSLKKMVLKLETDLLAVRLEALENKAKRVAVNLAGAANQAAELKLCRASHGVIDSCGSGEYWPQYYTSDDDY